MTLVCVKLTKLASTHVKNSSSHSPMLLGSHTCRSKVMQLRQRFQRQCSNEDERRVDPTPQD